MNILASKTVDVPHTQETTDLGIGRDFEAEVIVFNDFGFEILFRNAGQVFTATRFLSGDASYIRK